MALWRPPPSPIPPVHVDGYPHTYTLCSTHPIPLFKQLFAPPTPFVFFRHEHMNHCMDVHPPSEMYSKDRGVYVKNYMLDVQITWCMYIQCLQEQVFVFKLHGWRKEL
jgi:hypothetical protein